MKLGAFSISLNVKDLSTSKEFYEALGFSKFGGDEAFSFLIMKNGDTLIGLFQGMIDANMLTFNPGWHQNAEDVYDFDTASQIREKLIKSGIDIGQETSGERGIQSFVVIDPDGNPILIDQHR